MFLHLPSTVWPRESLFMYGAISAGVRGVKRETLTRGSEPAAASSGTEWEQVTFDSLHSFNSVPYQPSAEQQCFPALTASHLTAPPDSPCWCKENKPSWHDLILNSYPMQVAKRKNVPQGLLTSWSRSEALEGKIHSNENYPKSSSSAPTVVPLTAKQSNPFQTLISHSWAHKCHSTF